MLTPKNPAAHIVNQTGKKRPPDFYGVGAEKCGTTWLWEMFHDHPEIGVPLPKELRYFARIYLATGLNNFNAVRRLMRNHRKVPQTPEFLERLATEIRILYGRDPAYLRVFGAMDQASVGDISPQYCMLPSEGIAHMHRLAPNAKIIFMLRDPVDRAISAAKMKAGEEMENLTQNAVREKAFHPFQIAMSRYSGLLDNYQEVFGEKNIFVGFMEDVISRPLGLLEEICDFLGVGYDAAHFTRLNFIANEGLKFAVEPQIYKDLFNELRDEYDLLETRFPERVAGWREKHQTKYGAR